MILVDSFVFFADAFDVDLLFLSATGLKRIVEDRELFGLVGGRDDFPDENVLEVVDEALVEEVVSKDGIFFFEASQAPGSSDEQPPTSIVDVFEPEPELRDDRSQLTGFEPVNDLPRHVHDRPLSVGSGRVRSP